MTTQEQLAALRTPAGRALLARAAALAGQDPLAAASALRAGGARSGLTGTDTGTGPAVDAGLVSAALTQTELRRRAVRKFGADAARMFFTRQGLEQATRSVVATRRAARLAHAGVRTLADLGCGIGADTLAAARAGIRVHAVEADPTTVAFARANATALELDHLIQVHCADATCFDLSGVDAVFCDPARRRGDTGRRVFDPNAYAPPWDFVTGLPARIPRTALKLAPGIDHTLIPAGAEAQWVSVAGEVVEAAVWCGPLAEVPRRATLLPAGSPTAPPTGTALGAPEPTGTSSAEPPEAGPTEAGPTEAGPTGAGPTGAGPPEAGPTGAELVGTGEAQAPVGPVGRFLYDPDGAVVRAHLVAEFAALVNGRLADPTIAYVYADQAVDTPFARCFEVLEALPFSVKRLRAALRAREVGRVEVHKRGSAVDVEQLRRDLRLRGAAGMTVMLTRVAGAPTALLCAPRAPAHGPPGPLEPPG